MGFYLMRRPIWSKTFIEETKDQRYSPSNSKQGHPFRAWLLSLTAFAGLCVQLCLLLVPVHKLWIIIPSIAWTGLAAHTIISTPRRFHLVILVFVAALFVSQCLLLVKTWQSVFDLELRLVMGATTISLVGVIVVINMPMREPGWSRFGISKPFTEPTDKLRSPEDNLTFWQWMTVSWVSPLLRLAKTRQLNADDIWSLPYEFQHTYLHDAFRQLKGSVFRRLMVANWVDLVVLTILELVEIATNYSEPVLLQQLLKAMQHLQTEKRPALTYTLLILLVRVVNAQSEVFSLWYGRRCYERSRGELITMLYEKTLHRKIVAQPKEESQAMKETTAELDRVLSSRTTENTPLLGKSIEERPRWLQRTWNQLRTVWTNFRTGVKGGDLKQQEPAGMGKIMNLMRYDSYEVCQRFWDFQKLIEKPLGLLISVTLILRLLGWPAFVGIAVIAVAQIMNYLLALVSVRLEKVRRVTTDKRLQQTSQYIESIRHLRWYGWQNYWLKDVLKARQRELNMKVAVYVWNQLITFNNIFCSWAIVVAAFWAYTSLAGRQLSVAIIFPALVIFELIQDNMSEIPDLIQSLLNAHVALKRIQVFMDEPDLEVQITESENSREGRVEFRQASFAWPGLTQNVLQDIDLSFDVGITVVAGEVAAGKTALLQAILGELDLRAGQVDKPQSPMAYCSQTPWLQSMTIRDNILFNSPFQPEKYKRTLHACALLPDLASFEKGDLSPIGENGIGLSGGQKARVALARAIYSDASIVLLDDPLSALDQQTSAYIVNECFLGELMKGRTVILVTHRIDLCQPIANCLVTIDHGKARTGSQTPTESTVKGHGRVANGDHIHPIDHAKLLNEAIPDKFEEEERRAQGEIKARVYWEYLKAGSLSAWIVILIAVTGVRFVGIGMNWYLKEFGEAYDDRYEQMQVISYMGYAFDISSNGSSFFDKLFEKFPDPRTNVSPWLIGLLVLTVIQALTIITSHSAMLTARYLSGKNLFIAVMQKITNTTFRYYDITPVGRLMNRLTSDIGQVDSGIGSELFGMLYNIVTWVASIAVIASINIWFLAVAVLLTGLYFLVFFQFLPTSQNLRRLETVSLSPLMTNFGTLLAGLTTVRAFCAQDRFQAKLIKVVDNFQGMDHFYWSVQGWLSYRLEILSAVSTFGLTVIAIYIGLSAGLTAFILVSAQRFIRSTHALCRIYGKIQVNFVSVERVVELLDIDQEPTNLVAPPAWWPSFGGDIVFENVTIRYAPHLEPALRDVSFELKGGTNTAIVGRTGSGKSTLAASLLATVPVECGRIIVDGVDLATVDKQALRSRVTFLAQEPVLFEGTLRHNLDPTEEHSDQQCAAVIDRVAGRFLWTLTMSIETGGKNLSQGQRQLVGLARAILRQNSIIVMDEATASIDVETAWEIQRVLREELKGTTVITIAHRTTAVRDADNALVLANGRLSSFGPATAVLSSTMSEALS